MTLKNFVYITDAGRRYLIKIDAELGAIHAFGFSAPAATDGELDPPPRGVKLRTIGCRLVVSSDQTKKAKYRTFAVATKTASVLASNDKFTYKGDVYIPHRVSPERRRK